MKTKKLIKEMASYSEKLAEGNREKFDDILLTIRYSNISEQDAEEFSYHCLNLFLQAEQENVDIKTILGTDDMDAFCNEYIEQVHSSYNLLKKSLLAIRYIPMLLLIFTGFFEMLIGVLLPLWIKQKELTFIVPVTLYMIIDCFVLFVITNFMLRYFGKISFDLNYGTKKQDRKWTLVIFFGYLLTLAFFVVSRLYLSQILFHVHFILFLLVCVALDRLLNYTLGKMN